MKKKLKKGVDKLKTTCYNVSTVRIERQEKKNGCIWYNRRYGNSGVDVDTVENFLKYFQKSVDIILKVC